MNMPQRLDAGALDSLASDISKIAGISVERNAPSGPLCTYRVGGPIGVLARIETPDALTALAERVAVHDPLPMLVIGKGSNLLIADVGFAGLGLLLVGDAFTAIDISGVTVTAGAAAPLPLVARASVREGLTDFEWAVGVPGTVGGGVRMNAGGHGSDMSANLVSVDVVDFQRGGRHTIAAGDLELGYRRSNLAAHQVVVAATLRLAQASVEPHEEDKTAGEATLSDIVRWRRSNQPGGQNAGSVFTNPANDSAGRLIDVAGLKGRRVGTAEVSTVHANFIQVDPNGSANDVMALMREMVAAVDAMSGIRLHAETRLVSFADVDVAFVQPMPTNPHLRTRNGSATTKDGTIE